jgi:hypothetical protein
MLLLLLLLLLLPAVLLLSRCVGVMLLVSVGRAVLWHTRLIPSLTCCRHEQHHQVDALQAYMNITGMSAKCTLTILMGTEGQ